jgi:hypothetical protein
MAFGKSVTCPTEAILNTVSRLYIERSGGSPQWLLNEAPDLCYRTQELMKFMGADFEMATKS